MASLFLIFLGVSAAVLSSFERAAIVAYPSSITSPYTFEDFVSKASSTVTGFKISSAFTTSAFVSFFA